MLFDLILADVDNYYSANNLTHNVFQDYRFKKKKNESPITYTRTFYSTRV